MGYQNQPHKIAILFFTRTAAEEAWHKTFARSSGYKKNCSLAREFIGHTRRMLEDSEYPVFTITQKQQQGETFGERFKNAYLQLFQKGFDKVLALGNDCPALTLDMIHHAVSQLKSNDYVIGPTSDGGTYLLGISRNRFKEIPFQQLAWETGELLQDLQHYIDRFKFSSDVLDELYDIDDYNDLKDLLDGVVKVWDDSKIQQFIIALLFLLTGWLNWRDAYPVVLCDQSFGVGNALRAPPQVLRY